MVQMKKQANWKGVSGNDLWRVERGQRKACKIGTGRRITYGRPLEAECIFAYICGAPIISKIVSALEISSTEKVLVGRRDVVGQLTS